MRRQVTADELDLLYRSIGKCVWFLQYLEDALNSYITMKHEVKAPGGLPENEARQALAKHRRNTLGTSIKIVQEHSLLDANLIVELVKFKEERDWLIHRSQNSHGDLLYTDQGRAETFARLASFTEEALRLRDQVVQTTEAFVASFGIDTAAVEKMARANIGRLRGGA